VQKIDESDETDARDDADKRWTLQGVRNRIWQRQTHEPAEAGDREILYRCAHPCGSRSWDPRKLRQHPPTHHARYNSDHHYSPSVCHCLGLLHLHLLLCLHVILVPCCLVSEHLNIHTVFQPLPVAICTSPITCLPACLCLRL
jgi:hypothetical protein